MLQFWLMSIESLKAYAVWFILVLFGHTYVGQQSSRDISILESHTPGLHVRSVSENSSQSKLHENSRELRKHILGNWASNRVFWNVSTQLMYSRPPISTFPVIFKAHCTVVSEHVFRQAWNYESSSFRLDSSRGFGMPPQRFDFQRSLVPSRVLRQSLVAFPFYPPSPHVSGYKAFSVLAGGVYCDPFSERHCTCPPRFKPPPPLGRVRPGVVVMAVVVVVVLEVRVVGGGYVKISSALFCDVFVASWPSSTQDYMHNNCFLCSDCFSCQLTLTTS